jgi:hypothetical protein
MAPINYQGWPTLLLAGGILVLTMGLTHWVAWLFAWGRFGKAREHDLRTPLRFVVAEFFTKLIDDFRHLLALVVIAIFAGILIGVLVRAPNFAEIKDGLQVVAATMGGIVGSIIGYYFGESAGRRASKDVVSEMPLASRPPIQGGAVDKSPAELLSEKEE